MTQPKLWFNWGSTFVAMTTSTLFLSDPRRNIWFFVKASVIQIVMFRLESCDSRIHTHIDYSHSFISTLIIIMIIIYICIYIYCICKYFNKKNDTNNNSQVSNQGRVTWHLANRWRLHMDWRGHFDRSSARTLHETMGFNPEICIHKRFLVGVFS